MSPTADNLGALGASTKGVVNVIDHKGLTVIYMDLYMAERPRSKHSSRIAFTLKPMAIHSIRLKIIGQMKRTKFLVDVIQPVGIDDTEAQLPPLSRVEARELVGMVQVYVDQQLTRWGKDNPEERTRVCVNITPDLLDAEILGT